MHQGLTRTMGLLGSRRLLLIHMTVAFFLVAGLHLADVVSAGALLSWLLIAWVVASIVLYVVVVWRRFVGRALQGYPGEVPTEGIVITGSVSSRVVLDFDAGTAEKAYGSGTPLVRWLYRLCFQAPFPYTANEAALDTAVHRRTVIGLLTKFWFGENLVAPILEIRRLDTDHLALVTELIRGDAPTNIPAARALLHELTVHFLESGLPVWQVADYNPRAIGNLIERPDGRFSMIDLESNLVTPFLPPAAIIRSIRRGQYPSFDDIDISRLRDYLEANAAPLEAVLRRDYRKLLAATDQLEDAQARWFASEPRWLPRALRFAFRLIDVPTWVRGVRRLAARGQTMGEEFVEEGVDTWVGEGHISAEEADSLKRSLANPEVALVLANLGAHLAFTIPLRFPFGSLTRFFWTLGSRLTAEWRALRRRESAAVARRVHTIPVMFATLLPSVGVGAYLLATPLRKNTALELIAVDSVLRRLPFRIHQRFHLVALLVWFATPKAPPIHWEHWDGIRDGFLVRWRKLGACPRWFWAVIALDLSVLLVGGGVYFSLDDDVLFHERGVLATMAAVQLYSASVLGVLAYRRFWSVAGTRGVQERAGNFLWGLSGLGLVLFATDDYFTIHERVGRWFADEFETLPLLTNNVDDVITLSYGIIGLAALHVFRHEVMQVRASSALYLFGVVAAAAMLVTDAYGHSVFQLAEFPAQIGAVGLLFLAHTQRFLEVSALRRGAAVGSDDSAAIETATTATSERILVSD